MQEMQRQIFVYQCIQFKQCIQFNVAYFIFVSLLTEADAGHTEFIDEVYENNSRYPGAEWKIAKEPYTDVVCIVICVSNVTLIIQLEKLIEHSLRVPLYSIVCSPSIAK